MGESNVKMIKLSTSEIYGIAMSLHEDIISLDIDKIARINIELDFNTNTGNIIIVPRSSSDETLSPTLTSTLK